MLSKNQGLAKPLEVLDGYDFGYDQAAARYTASEVVRRDPHLMSETGLLKFVNDMLWKQFGPDK